MSGPPSAERSPNPGSAHESTHRLAWSALVLAMMFGGILRWIWIEDMEWKHDEQWTYQMSQTIGRTAPWPREGMATSLGFPNPGLSVWSFVALGRLASTPTRLALVIAVLNVLGLVGFLAPIRAGLPARFREPWVWGIALQAINPYAIRMSRKTWPPSILMPFVLVFWVGHLNRRARWGSFLWGLLGAILGQIHLSGWFLAAGLALCTAIQEARSPRERSSRWGWWLLGTAVGMVGALPWIIDLWGSVRPGGALHIALPSVDDITATGYLVCSIASGVLPYQGLGLGPDAAQFETGPVVRGLRLHLPDLIHIYITLMIAGVIASRLVAKLILAGLGRIFGSKSEAKEPHREAAGSGERSEAAGNTLSTGFYLWATVATPIVLFVCVIRDHFHHYYFVLCPFLFVGLAAILLPWRRALFSLVMAQALISFAFLEYIHSRGGAPRGEYGVGYARTVESANRPGSPR